MKIRIEVFDSSVRQARPKQVTEAVRVIVEAINEAVVISPEFSFDTDVLIDVPPKCANTAEGCMRQNRLSRIRMQYRKAKERVCCR